MIVLISMLLSSACGAANGPGSASAKSDASQKAPSVRNHAYKLTRDGRALFATMTKSTGRETEVCVSEEREWPSIRSMVEYSITEGATTCYRRGKLVVFRVLSGGCTGYASQNAIASAENYDAAAEQFLECSASMNSNVSNARDSITFALNRAGAEAQVEFADFGIDLVALANHGGMPAYSVAVAYDVACVDTDNAELFNTRMRQMDFVDTSLFKLAVHRGELCNQSTQNITGREWVSLSPP